MMIAILLFIALHLPAECWLSSGEDCELGK